MCKCSISARYQTSLLASLGFLISFGIRCNMGIAMIQMTAKHEEERFNFYNNSNCTNITGSLSVQQKLEYNYGNSSERFVDHLNIDTNSSCGNITRTITNVRILSIFSNMHVMICLLSNSMLFQYALRSSLPVIRYRLMI